MHNIDSESDIRRYQNMAEQATTKPDDFGWWGREDMFETWGFTGISYNNSSSVMEESNFEVISKDLLEKYPDDFKIITMKHWAVGQVTTMIVRVYDDNPETGELTVSEPFKELITWHDHLADYPCADDAHYSEKDYEEVLKYIRDFANPMISQVDDFDSEIYSYLSNEEDIYMSYDGSELPSEEEMIRAAFWLGFIDREYQEEWDDFVVSYRLPVIDWEKTNLKPFAQIPGQLNLEFGE